MEDKSKEIRRLSVLIMLITLGLIAALVALIFITL